MAIKNSDEKEQKNSQRVIVDYNMKTHENDPYFINKAKEAAIIIEGLKLPKDFKKSMLGIGS